MTYQLLIREAAIAPADDSGTGERTFTGIAVPFNTPVSISDWWGDAYSEQVAPGAVVNASDDMPLVFWRHDDPIGRITAFSDTPDGWQVTGSISQTPRGDEAYTLLQDGVLDRMSIGFEPLEDTVTTDPDTGAVTVTRTQIRVREVSLVPFPAYDDAKVTAVRSQTPEAATAVSATKRAAGADTEDSAMAEDTITRADLDATAEDIERRFSVQLAGLAKPEQAIDRRSAGEIIKAIVAGDEATRAAYTETVKRAYTGGTSADTVNNPA
ncbi:hypothetical protein GCM10022286_05600 [Gryllotalpicola daejeonensis]|uniref:Prohead serine protease domain-containing protein n=1 Tax=Gryllotalpicola daejeonensis TaxID=993087 RepID=A0ABP7ZFK1_9MICO